MNATIPATSGKSDARGFGSGVFAAVAGFATAGWQTSSE
jgi:hypothetical protein